MKTINKTTFLACAGLLMSGVALHPTVTRAQSAQGQNQTENRAKQLQSQPPRINTDQEWRAAVEFMQANCPNRLAFVVQLQNRPIQFERAKERILKQYRQISNTKDPEIHQLAVKQAQIQDQVFGALDQIRNTTDPRKKQEAQRALRAAEEDQVKVQIALRMVRIDRLKKEIEDFEKKRDSYVDRWMKDELKRAATGDLDDGSNRSGNAAIADPEPPTKK